MASAADGDRDRPLLDPFRIGDRVAWHGATRRLEGTIIVFVPPRTRPGAVLRSIELAAHVCYYGGRPRGEDSYLVRVDEPGKPPAIHWPWTWRLFSPAPSPPTTTMGETTDAQ